MESEGSLPFTRARHWCSLITKSVAIHSPLGLKFLPLEKANVIVDCLETSSHHTICVRKIMSG